MTTTRSGSRNLQWTRLFSDDQEMEEAENQNTERPGKPFFFNQARKKKAGPDNQRIEKPKSDCLESWPPTDITPYACILLLNPCSWENKENKKKSLMITIMPNANSERET